jgi:hypothetical protein
MRFSGLYSVGYVETFEVFESSQRLCDQLVIVMQFGFTKAHRGRAVKCMTTCDQAATGRTCRL